MIKTYHKHSIGKLNMRSFSRMFIANFKKRKILLFSLISLLIVLPISLIIFNNKSTVEAAWMNDAWSYRQRVDISNSGAATTNQYVKITLDTASLITASKMQNDCDDIRITNVRGKLLTHFVDGDSARTCNDSDTAVYVMVDSISTSGTSVFLYYGNSAAATAEPRLGTIDHPAISCRNILEHKTDSTGNGQYYISPSGNFAEKIQVTCDMTYSSGGWTLVYHGLPSEAMVLNTTNESVKLSNNIVFNDIRMQGVNLNFNVTTTTTETAQLSKTIPQYYYEVDQASDATSPKVNFHDLSGNQDVLLTNNYFMFGYGNSWRVFYTCINVSGINNLYIGGYSPSCTPRSSFISTDVGCSGGGNHYCGNARTTTPKDSGLNLSLYEYQETKVYVRENDITLNNNQSAASPTNEEKSPAPVAYWKFDDGTGATAQDSTVNNNDGTITGATWQGEDQCISGKCLFFNGGDSSGDNVYSSNGIFTNNNGAFTVSAWVKANKAPTTQGRTAVSTYRYNGGGVNIQGWNLGTIWTGTYFAFEVHDGVAQSASASYSNFYAQYLNQWVYVTGVYKPSEYVYLYINGKLVASTTSNVPAYITYPNSTTRIGRRNVDAQSYWNGLIDDVKIYSYARSAAQIKADFASRGSGSVKGTSVQMGTNPKNNDAFSNGLVGYWKMDEAAANTCTGGVNDSCDSSGNGRDASWGGSPTITSGKFSNSVSLPGGTTAEYISLPNTTLTGLSETTVAMWINATSGGSGDGIFSGASVTHGDNAFLFYQQTNLAIYIKGSAWSSGVNLADSTWHHLAMTRNATSGLVQVFVDGTLRNSTTSLPTGTVTIDTNGLVLGQEQDSVGGGFDAAQAFNGKYNDVRIYNRALSPREVRDLYAWAPGPVGYWNMDEKTGTTLNDKSGNSNNSTLWNGTPLWQTGKFGSSLYFDGSGTSGVEISSPSNFASPAFTAEVWVDGTNQAGATRILNYGTNGSNFGGFIIGQNSGGTLRTYIDTTGAGGWDLLTSTGTVNNGAWHHLALVYDGTNRFIYIDGVKDASTDIPAAYFKSPTTPMMSIGQGTSDQEEHKGKLDDVRIYNYARTPGQIVEDMNAGHPIGGSPVGSQVGYWKFDEGYGTTANNSGSQSTTATINSATWTNEGKFGRALIWNSSDLVSSTLNYNSGKTFTLSAYIKPTASASFKVVLGTSMGNNIDSGIILNANNLCFHDYATGPADFNICSTNNPIILNTWQQVALTYDNGNINLYHNGKVVQTGSFAKLDSAAGIIIGGNTSLLASRTFEGSIDEVKIYNAALTADEIKLDYNRGSAMVLGTMSDTSNLTGGSVASSSASAAYCIPGDTATCNPPVGEWKMDEKTGTVTTYDTSGNGINATLQSSPSWTQGKFGSGLSFNGTSQYLTTPSNSLTNFSAAGQYTIESWVKLDQYQPNGGTGGCCGSRIAYNNSGNGGFDWRIWNSGTVNFYRPTTWCSASSSQTVPLNQWVHLAATYNNQQVYIYMNGKQIASTSSCNFLDSTAGVTINYPGGNHGLYGDMDNVQIYNYARTPAQIAYDYNRGAPVGHWKMDECQGIATNDSSGNGNAGTITIGTTIPQSSAGTCTDGLATSAWYNGRTGKYNASLNFDGVDDYVNLSNPSLLNNITTKTISFWTYLNAQVGAGGVGSHWLNKGDSSGGWFISTDPGNSRNIYGQHFGAGTAGRWSFPQFSISQWHHVVVTYDRSSTANNPLIYVDGIPQIVTRYSTPTGTAGDDSGNSLLISKSPGFDRFVLGQIDDVRIYNYALTPVQIKTLYNGGAAIQFAPATGSP